jgi:SAM-dependent methyltransferase
VIRKLVDGIPEEDWAASGGDWLAVPVLHQRKEGSGDWQGGEERGHPRRHAVVYAELDCEVPGAEQHWPFVVDGESAVGLAAQMAYYIQPAEQTPEVQAQLDALIRVRVAEDGEALNPESITVLDPACGSGHILVEAYDLLKAIYLERGYREREIPRLILKNNLFGLDIDDRAAQLAGFALLMKARADDRRLFEAAALDLVPLVQQAKILAMKFDAVVANPPYMGGKNLPEFLKSWAEDSLRTGKADLFAMFIVRSLEFAKNQIGTATLVTMQSWMFISTFESLRRSLLEQRAVNSLVQIGFNSFPEMNSKIAQASAFSISKARIPGFRGSFVNLNGAPKNADKQQVFLQHTRKDEYFRNQESFTEVPGAPLAYWASDKVREAWSIGVLLGKIANPKKGLDTGENERFLRHWQEVSFMNITRFDAAKFSSQNYWVPIQKGGAFRRWYGNLEYVVDWRRNGAELRSHPGSSIRNERFYGVEGATWSTLTSSDFSMRHSPAGFIFESKGAVCFPIAPFTLPNLLAFGNSCVAQAFFSALSQTMDYHEGPFGLLPYVEPLEKSQVAKRASRAVEIAKADWDATEDSWDFLGIAIAWRMQKGTSLSKAWSEWHSICCNRILDLKEIQEANNAAFVLAYGLQDEISREVPEDQITLNRADREKDCQRLISYAIGCMMGRYSLDEPGLIYAHAGNVGFDPARYKTFPADVDGILPVTDDLWFEDDAANRVREFLRAVWGPDTLEENMAWLAESLGNKGNETPDETIRRYLADRFFKDHLQTYKKRPIYWLFSSGKQSAFQALVYLHRYNEGTLARMRAEYVVPLTGKMQSRIEMLEKDREAATSTATRNKIAKQIESLKKKHVELLAYDEKLRHYADRRITLDLDDGVKVNYGKFGDLLAEVKAVTGGASDE